MSATQVKAVVTLLLLLGFGVASALYHAATDELLIKALVDLAGQFFISIGSIFQTPVT